MRFLFRGPPGCSLDVTPVFKLVNRAEQNIPLRPVYKVSYPRLKPGSEIDLKTLMDLHTWVVSVNLPTLHTILFQVCEDPPGRMNRAEPYRFSQRPKLGNVLCDRVFRNTIRLRCVNHVSTICKTYVIVVIETPVIRSSPQDY